MTARLVDPVFFMESPCRCCVHRSARKVVLCSEQVIKAEQFPGSMVTEGKPDVYSLIVAQVFFLYFTLFHVYFFSFPFGFSYLALITTVLFLQHSMLFFWNRYEASVSKREVALVNTDVDQACRRRLVGAAFFLALAPV